MKVLATAYLRGQRDKCCHHDLEFYGRQMAECGSTALPVVFLLDLDNGYRPQLLPDDPALPGGKFILRQGKKGFHDRVAPGSTHSRN